MKYSIRMFVMAVLAAATLSFPLAVHAAQQNLGSFQDWTAFSDGGDRRICYIGSLPQKAEGNYTRRGDTYVLATHRPAESVFGEISVEAGYTYKAGSEVEVNIDGRAFRLFTQGGNAWAYDERADQELVAAMKAGSRMIVKGTSTRGTLTTDTYSLAGFTAAYEAINRACRG